jgi:hypothetical protein
MIRLSTLLLLLLPSFFLQAQSKHLNGQWKGVITQNEGGYRSEYSFEMYFQQKGNKVYGRSYVYVDKIFAEMELHGFWVDKSHIQFTEIKITRCKREANMDWCIKKGNLKLVFEGSRWRLEGGWSGSSSFGDCIPGKIFLTKVKPRV